MYYEDQPYETYNACAPCNPMQGISNRALGEISNTRQYAAHRRSYPREEHYRLPDEEIEKAIDCPKYNDDEFRMARKESIFNPRTSLNFINGFKEWVSCLVLGTNRRKSNRKLVLKDRKSVTSVFLSNNSQSLTGQRLSSFSEYASISISKGSQKSNQSLTRPSGNSVNASNHASVTKKKSRKKRPAPLPPIQYNGAIDSNSEDSRRNRLSNGISDVALCRRDSQRDRRNNKIISKTVKSTSSVSHAVPVKKRYKKRRAPPPPAVLATAGSAIYATVIKKDSNSQNNASSLKLNDFAHPVKHCHHRIHRRNSNDWEVPGTSSKVSKHRTSQKHLKKGPHISAYVNSKNSLVGSDSEDSSSGSISFSPNESGDDKYGLVNYRAMKVIDGVEGEASIPRSSSYVQYSSDNSDVCLKISIQKTETNVVTVEEVPAPRTVHYTIEEDSSSSELSDEPPVIPVKIKSIEAPHQESKANSTDSSTVSTEENSDQSKTIFEELKLKPPVKGSVKDFVNAFNMLASQSNSLPQIPNQITNAPKPQDSHVNSGASGSKNIQSFPTKWEFQNNKAANLVFSSSQFLLPIAEESLNETSEHDGNVEESNANNSGSSKLKNKKNITPDHKHLKYEKTVDVNENTNTCSHCSEKHSPASTTKKQSTKKRIAPHREKATHSEKAQLSNSSSKASMLALSSLLQEKVQNEKQDMPSCSSKPDLKLDQPIMVGLYIEDKSSHRGPIPLLVTPSMSLRKLKKQVEAEYDFPHHQQCWILGESFAVQEDVSLASYGVTEAGCPILLYVMAKESKSHSLPCRASTASTRLQTQSSSSEEEVASPRQHRRRKSKPSPHKEVKQVASKVPKPEDDKSYHGSTSKKPQKETQDKFKNTNKNKTKSDYHKAWEEEYNKKADYRTLLALDDVDLVANMEPFECPVCFLDVEINEGIVLQDCLHNFCRECLSSAIQYSDTAVIKCPFRNDEYSCESHLQEREIKCLVSPDVYERHLQRSMALAESQARDSFHCKTPDCPGWCLFEDNVNTFLCPVCKHTNCLTCAAIHEGRNCRQYQDHLALSCDTSEEAKKTKEYLQNMVENGEAMECPQCQVILMKKWGCDWLKCSMCHTEVCWVTKGRRWGPGGKGDTSGGCKCMLNGVRCHPKCSYCH
ncbi:ranBP-type and C3HC4-type zinc finger-containing protein 1 [Trichonephila clavata]|nr:ranBP-type and C3HC4-type zinc finger-containing protein 1 [Trichonephila clavata]